MQKRQAKRMKKTPLSGEAMEEAMAESYNRAAALFLTVPKGNPEKKQKLVQKNQPVFN